MAAAAEKRVVVVGGGYAGNVVAHALDKKFAVSLIDRSEVKYHNIAAPRAIADTSGAWVSRILVPRNLRRGRFVHAAVQHVDFAAQQVVLASGERLAYDYLVLATGSNTSWPAKPDSAALWTRASIVEHFRTVHAAVKESKRIAVLGGGATGTELAAELRHWHPEKEVVLFSSAEQLIGPDFKPKFYKKVDEQLAELGVRVVKGNRARVEGGKPLSSSVGPQPVSGPCTVAAGATKFEADLVFNCIGAEINNKIVQDSEPSLLDKTGRVDVLDTLQLKSHPNVFCCGDLCGKDPRRMAFVAGAQAALVVANITKHAKGSKLGTKLGGIPPPTTPMCAVALSPSLGVIQLPIAGMVGGRKVTSAIKSKTLFCEQQFKEVGLPLPALTAAV